MFSLEQLRGFVAVAEHLHFGRAATALQMTQPPLSRQIQKLETDLGVQLFDRTSRTVTLTPAGAALLERAPQILALAERSRAAVRSVELGEEGSLVLGYTALASLSTLGPVLETLHRILPGVDIELRERVTSVQLTELERGSIDLGLVRTVPRDPEILAREVFREDLVVALPTDHPLAKGSSASTLDELVPYPMIGYVRPEAEYFLRKTEQLFGDRPLRVVYTVSQVMSMLALVSQGFGFALVPRSTERLGMAGVVFQDLSLPRALMDSAQVSLYAAWSTTSRNPAVRRTVDALSALGQTTMRDVHG